MINGVPFKKYRFEEILREQMLICTLSKGAISIEDTNNLPISDRGFLLKNLYQMEEQRQKAIEEAANTKTPIQRVR